VNCRKVNSLLSAYMDGELPGVEQLQIRQHLRDCCCCNDEYETLLSTKRMLSGLCVKQPRVDLEQQILQCLAEETQRRSGPVDLRASWQLLGYGQKLRLSAMFATGAIAVLLLVVTQVKTDQQPSENMMALAPAPTFTSPSPQMVPVNDLILIHNPLENAPAAGFGQAMSPVSANNFSMSSGH
jgi:predicted anti-sigma-YlaC factor YlaD